MTQAQILTAFKEMGKLVRSHELISDFRQVIEPVPGRLLAEAITGQQVEYTIYQMALRPMVRAMSHSADNFAVIEERAIAVVGQYLQQVVAPQLGLVANDKTTAVVARTLAAAMAEHTLSAGSKWVTFFLTNFTANLPAGTPGNAPNSWISSTIIA